MSNLGTASEVLGEIQSRAWEHVNRLAPEDQHPVHACISAMLSAVAVAKSYATIHGDPVLDALRVWEGEVDASVRHLHDALPEREAPGASGVVPRAAIEEPARTKGAAARV